MNNGFAGVLHRGNQAPMDDSAVSVGFSLTSYTTGSHGQSQITFGTDKLGSAMNNNSSHGHKGFQRPIHPPVQDDGCRLILGLGPTPDPDVNFSDHHQPAVAGADKSTRPPVTLFGQSFSFADPGALSLGIHQGRSAGATKHLGVPAGTIISFSTVDEGSTSARRSSGGYMPSLLFAPRPNYSTSEKEQGLVDDADDSNDGTDPRGFRLSPEPSASMTEASFGGVSSDVVTVASNPGQKAQRRHPKKCRFKGCSKGARHCYNAGI